MPESYQALTCPECEGRNLTGRGTMNSEGQWETDWTCDRCGNEFGTVKIDADELDNSLGAMKRRARKRQSWASRVFGGRR